jgi:UDP-N-acetylmuramoyl-tripeptide--D-alanyl-D-alanine ligase
VFRPRLQRLNGINGHTLINDAYNANPTAMIAGLRVLKQVAGRRTSVAVLGDMSELGAYTRSGHRRVGHVVAKLGISHVIVIGSRAREIAAGAAAQGFPMNRIRCFRHMAEAASYIRGTIPPKSVIYFKASRNVHLENLVNQLRIS